MKTQTRSQIVKMIDENGMMRPIELARALKLSPQAIHRHLRRLAEAGVLEARGAPPFTQYALAGVPNFEAAFDWMKARSITDHSVSQVSETRDILAARLPRLKTFLEAGLPVTVLPLVVSTAGEVGNNSFDHNLGQWRDVPGCWFEAQATGKYLWLCVADRGQGVFRSLKRVQQSLESEQAALELAFEKIISGRAPDSVATA
jgi:DNA-binding transcriptional ArsR family regulator